VIAGRIDQFIYELFEKVRGCKPSSTLSPPACAVQYCKWLRLSFSAYTALPTFLMVIWKQLMAGKATWLVSIAALTTMLLSIGFWFQAHELLVEARASLVSGELLPIATILKENEELMRALQSPPFSENDAGILESYLAMVRRDGVAKHADMKQRLDALAENNSAIVTLIKTYAPHAKTAEFKQQSDKFRNYASAWRDRWNSVMEIFMAGGNYAVAGVPFPSGFAAAVDAEIAGAK
jgi:hypothetical protein